MQLELLGGAREVGRSAVAVVDRKTNIILDYGSLIQTVPPQYPLPTRSVSAVILSHAHLDHSGGLPILYKKEKPPLFMTDVTLDSSVLLIKDSMKIVKKQGYDMPFSKNDFKRMIDSTKLMNYHDRFSVNGFSCVLYDAGHIPGSSGILLNGKKRIFYTGDIKLDSTRLLNGCTLPEKADVLITESTYSQTEHPNREGEEKRFISAIEEALAIDETILIPVFALGRAQEILLILEKYSNKIALDGMAKSASEIILQYKYHLKEPEKLKKILNRVTWVRNDKEREKAVKKFPIIVTTAAMMGGGPVLFYLKELHDRPEAKILFVGYLIEDSPARNLLETGILKIAEESYHVHCDVQQFDLSSHAGRSELFEIIKKLKPEKVICVHGDECEKFARDVSESGVEAIAPNNGDVLEV